MGKHKRPHRKYLSSDFIYKIKSSFLYAGSQVPQKYKITYGCLQGWFNGINRAPIDHPELHRIAKDLKFPVEKMFEQ